MIRGIEAVMLNSANAKKLAEFYRDVVGLEIAEEYEMGENGNAYEMEVKDGSALYINDHSEVKGKTKEPQRAFINFEVDDIEKETKRLKNENVKVVQDIYHIEGYGMIATFEDPDGNYFQFVQVRAIES